MNAANAVAASLVVAAALCAACDGEGPSGLGSSDDAPLAPDAAVQTGERSNIQIRALDAGTGAAVPSVTSGLVRGDRRTVYARGEGTGISAGSHATRDGDLLFIAAYGYDPAIVVLRAGQTAAEVELQLCVDSMFVLRPEGLPEDTAIEVSESSVFDALDWRRESEDIVWGGPVKLVRVREAEEFPLRVPIPRGMKTRVYFDSVSGSLAPVGVTATPGERVRPNFVADSVVHVRAPIQDGLSEVILLCDWSSTPNVSREMRETLAGRVVRPIVVEAEFHDGGADVARVSDCTFHVVAVDSSGRRSFYGHVAPGEENVLLREWRTVHPQDNVTDATGACVLPGWLDVTTTMWLLNGPRSLSPLRATYEDAGSLHREDDDDWVRCTAYDPERGWAWMTLEDLGRSPEDWPWCSGSIATELPAGVVDGRLTIAADWDRDGRVLIFGSAGSLSLDASRGRRIVRSGLPAGRYRVTWDLRLTSGDAAPSATGALRGSGFVTVSAGAQDVTIAIPLEEK